MLMLLRVCSLSLVCAYGVVYAQSAAQPESTTSSTVPPAKAAVAKVPNSAGEEDIRSRGAQWLASCLSDWDRATHMTKEEWARTCRRVTRERVKFLIEQKETVTPGLSRKPANVAPR